MGSDSLNLSCKSGELERKCTQKISVSDQKNSLELTNFESDSFIIDMERLSHLAHKDMTANSRIELQRSLTRKLPQQKSSEKKIKSRIGNEKSNCGVSKSLPRDDLIGPSTPDQRPMEVTLGSKGQPISPLVHHQITILTGNIGAAAATGEVRCGGKRLSFRRSPSASWTTDPRKILLFFATLSSMGTMLLIYFTLSMGKLGWEENAMN